MASEFPKKTSAPGHLSSRVKMKTQSLLPSLFQREKSLIKKEASTGECSLPTIGPFLDKSETGRKPLLLKPVTSKQDLFQVSPQEIVFQNFRVHRVSEMTLYLVNMDKSPRSVRVTMENSPHFRLVGSNDAYHRVPAGARHTVRIHFTPDEDKDYSHELSCTSGKERIVVPVRAIGGRPILDFPDQLDFPVCIVKRSSEKTLVVQNTGNLEAHYEMSTKSPFSVVPARGTLGIGETMQVTVKYQPLTTGDHDVPLVVRYSTGERETIQTKLHGEAIDLNIGLSTYSVELEKTYITMSCHTTMFIENRSDTTAHFQWKTYPNEEEENQRKMRMYYLLSPGKEVWLENLLEEKRIMEERGTCEDRTARLSNIVDEEMAKVQQDPMLFFNDIFSIEPLEGEIGPHCLAKIKVTFKPQEALEYRSVAYCNITGRETRLPLKLRGEGKGPWVELSYHTLNLGNIYVNTPHAYEVDLINKGPIDAPFTFVPPTAHVANCFELAPRKGIIAPGERQTIQISFKATVLGMFDEEFQFSVAGSPMPAVLRIKGCIEGPNLHSDVKEIDFGDMAFGVPYTKNFRLTNASPVSLTFKLRMSDNGSGPVVTCQDQMCNNTDPSWRKGIHFYVEPKEFKLTPRQGTILPQGHQDIEVTLCSNTVMEYHRRILVDVEGAGEKVLSLTVMGRCIVPKLTVCPYILCYDECHLKEPYERKFLIVNDSHIAACYGLIAQKRKEDTPVFYSSSRPCGIVQPFSRAEIPVTIEAQKLGKYDTNVLIGVFGDERNPLRHVLRSTGTWAAIYPRPGLIEFGKIPALHHNTQTFHLVNEGLVPADFRMEVTRKPNVFTIDPSEGVIPPKSEILVTVTAIPDDTGCFDDVVELFIGDSPWTTFSITAEGIGTTIVTDKPFPPEINLGYQFSFSPCFRRFKFTNGGYHFHRLHWTMECYRAPEEEGQNFTFVSSSRDKEDSQSPEHTPLFQLQPQSMELQPGESAHMVVQGFSSIPQVVQNYVLCEAIIGERTTKEPIIETVLTCEFIDPSVEVSAKELFFRVEKKPSDVLTLQYQPLSLKNTCALPLDLMLSLEQPFMVCDAHQQPLPFGQPVTVDVGETSHLYVAFDPAYERDFHSWKEEKVLTIDMVRGHPYKEYITLRGEVHFPNLLIQPSALEFGCIKAGAEKVLSLEITNNSPLCVKYHWSFHEDSQVNKLRYEPYPPKFQPHPPTEKRTCLDCSTPQQRRFRIRNVEVPSPIIEELQRLARQEGLTGTEVPPYTRGHSYVPLGLGAFRHSIELNYSPIPVDQAFKILPLLGELQPGESQQVTFRFSGHLNSIARVTALCNVEGGPTYDVELTGEAQRIHYSLSVREINCGVQMFNEIHHSKVVLTNTGKIPFDWVLNPSTATADQALDGVFTVKPSSGSIGCGERKELTFSYLPGLPGAFCRIFELKVADLDPENICLKGKAVFPITSINLPWNIKGNEKYEKALEELIKNVQQRREKDKSLIWEKAETLKTETLAIQNLKSHMLGSDTVWDTWMQKKLVKKLIRQAALERQRIHTGKLFPGKEMRQNLVNIELPEYILDMGTVLKGYTEKRTVEISNPGPMEVSFQVDESVLQDTGFTVNLEEVNLSQRCAMSFEVCFESTRQPVGEVDVVLPIMVTEGPTCHIHLRAKVFGQSLNLSKDRFQFHDTIVGQCQVETVRLYNWFRVPCEWFISEVKPKKKPFIPPIRPKLKDRPKKTKEEHPCPFKVMPSRGIIGPGKWQNLEIQFAPKEERSYRNELKVNICGSSNHLKLYLSGQGLESRLEFSPPALKMGWVLVGSEGLEATVVVKNPCKFPIEFYSLDFDEQYLEEEKILRRVVGSEYPKTFLMPARAVGETLPPEVLEDYKAHEKLKAQQAELKAGAEAEADAEADAEAQDMGKAASACQGSVAFCPEPLVKAVGDPVSRAVMRHMGVEPSSDAAQQCRGIVVIVHGAPRAGKSELAAALCYYYDADYLSIDAVVKEAIADDGSEAGLRARELCTEAAKKLENEDKGSKKSKLAIQSKKKQGEKFKGSTKGKNKKKKEAASTPKKMDPKSVPLGFISLQWSTLQVTVSTAPAPQPLNISSSSGEELNCLSCVLPEDLLVDILSERLKHKDCYKGAIFDGLESLFASSLESSLLCVLKAVKNRHHIYIVNLHQDYASCKAREEAERKREEAERQEEERQQNEALERKVKHLLLMDEDEYDALPEEKKAEMDRILLERKKIRRERELKQLAQKLEKSKDLEDEEDEEELEEEKEDVSLVKQPAKPQKGKTKDPEKKETKDPEKKETKTPEREETKIPERKETKTPEMKITNIPERKEIKTPEMKITNIPEKWKYTAPRMWEIIIPDKEDTKAPEKGEMKAPKKGETEAPEKGETEAPEKGETKIADAAAEMEKNLILRFQIYESSQQNITQVYSYWDRVEGTLQLPGIQKENKSQPSAEQKDQKKTSKPQEKVVKKSAQKHGSHRSLQSSQLESQSEVSEGAVRDKHVGVPCLDIQVTNMEDMRKEILQSGRLPTEDQLLKHLGLHPNGPPLPPAAVLSIVDYPEERSGSAERVKPFAIVAPEGAAVEDNLAETPDAKGSSAKGQPKMDKVASKDKSPKENQISTQSTESPQDPSTRPRSSSEAKKSMLPSASLPTEFLRLKRYRWIVPAEAEVELKVCFCPTKSGKFQQTLRFELVGMKRLYELPCSGTGLYPSISQNPRLVFPQWRETIGDDEIVFKEYVESTNQFHFGPLLCGKSREWYKAQNFPGNWENITILNISPMEVEVHFSLENDKEGETFLLDPPSMTLQPKEKQELTIWAYPTSAGFLEDKLICCIEKNPNPVVFSLCCHGVLVKLEVIPQELSFDKLLLHSTASRTLVLKNNALLPMAWQLSGLDDLVENFSLSQHNGIIDPCSELEVTLSFTARQIGSIEKTLRLEVSDTENILGIVHAENIEISAEVYDVSLSIDMPEGPDGSLEFRTINDKVKKVLSLKNKGIYNIEYSFTLKGAGPRMRDLVSHFSIEPQSGMLIASQPGVNVELLFHPTAEILLKNKPILYCQVKDARLGEGGRIVANIPVRVSAKAVYSKYSIQPASPIDFGAIVKGTKKTQTVMLENKGMLSFKFRILQAPKDAPALERESSKQGESALLAPKHSVGRKSSTVTQGHLSLGMFTVSPCSGSIAPWGQQNITVECFAGQEGTCEEHIYFDITSRDPMDNPLGIPFTLTAESCLPALVEDVTLIFEEYPSCSSTDLSRKLRSVKGNGLFIRDENKFIFSKVAVGQQAEAHFKIYSASSLSCDVVLSIKPLPGEDKSPINIFKLHPVKMSVPGSSYAVATVTFTPQEEWNYDCTFKASLVIPKSPVKIKPQHLTFTISGKGHEPQVTVVCPSARSQRGNAVLRFKRLQLGDSEMLPLVFRNNGIVPVKFIVHLEDEQGAFFMKARKATFKTFHTEDVEEDSIENVSKHPKQPFLLLHHGQVAEFDVIFKPTLAQRLEGRICVSVVNIYSNKTQIELVGEGHEDEFTLDGLEEDTKERNAESSVKKDIIDAVRANHIQFGNCHIGKHCRRTFTITNRTRTKVLRFEWEADAPFQFSPKVGHLHPGCAKSITVTLKSDVPATFRRHLVKCKVAEINFELPQTKVEDWDDGMRVVTWKDTTRKLPGARWPIKERVLEAVPEPAHTVVEESSREAEVYLSALVAYAEFELSTAVVQFKDTFPFQTRTATFTMHNTGKVALEYSWEKVGDSEEAVMKPYSKTLMCKFLSSDTVRHRRKLLRHFWWQQEHRFEMQPSALLEQQRLAKLRAEPLQLDSEEEDSEEKEQDFLEQLQQYCEQLQLDFEEEEEDSEEKEQDFEEQLQQDSEQLQLDFQEQQQDSEQLQLDFQEQQLDFQEQQQDSEQLQLDFQEQQQDSEQLLEALHKKIEDNFKKMRQNEEKRQQTLLELRQECAEPPFQRVEWNVDAMDRVRETYEAMRQYYREHRESLAKQQLYFDEQWLDRCLSEYEELYPERHKPLDFHTEMQRMFQKHDESLEKQEHYFGEKIMQQFEAYRIYKKRQQEIAQAQQEAEYQRHQRYQQDLNYFNHLLEKGEFKKLVEYINQKPEDSEKWQQEIAQAQQEAEYQRHQRYQQDLNHFNQLLEQGEFKKLVEYINQQPQDSEPQQHSEEKELDLKKKRSKKRHHSKEQHLLQQQQQQPSKQQQQQPSKQQQSKQQKLHLSRQKHLSLQRVSSSLEIFPDLVHDLFSINPYQGTIAPGQKQTFHMLFSPECAGKFETTLLCRIPNLKPTQKKARVILKGRAQERKGLDEPKLSALQQTEKGQGPKKHVHWKPAPE
ncbi:hydrocephalus-inducing protein homolog [Aphelocoma coerulescens]|uniref:hydrocephalus-inducing protein homolog n=1 Tax=Aphelocoma coerulescens TaxID=39617 RepID=UPI003604B856